MDINATLFGEMITFAILVVVTMKYIWPPMLKAMNDRQKKIAEGLEASKRGKRELELAQTKVTEQLREAKQAASEILDQAHQRAAHLVEEGKREGKKAGESQVAVANEAITQEVNKARRALQQQLAGLAVAGAEKLVGRQIDPEIDQRLLDDLIDAL